MGTIRHLLSKCGPFTDSVTVRWPACAIFGQCGCGCRSHANIIVQPEVGAVIPDLLRKFQSVTGAEKLTLGLLAWVFRSWKSGMVMPLSHLVNTAIKVRVSANLQSKGDGVALRSVRYR